MYLSGHRCIGPDSYRFEMSVNVCFCIIVSYFLVAVNNLMLVYVFMADRCIFDQSVRMPFIAFIPCFSYFAPFFGSSCPHPYVITSYLHFPLRLTTLV